MHTMQELLERGEHALIGNYGRSPVVMASGQNATLIDASGKQYVDLFAGFGGGILGHCHPELVAALYQQAQQLWHPGNTFYSVPQIELSERLSKFAFAGQAFFCHSGAEANEAAVKLARLVGQLKDANKSKIISLNRSFHGRTLAMLAATGNPAYREGFGPAVPGFVNIDGGQLDQLEAQLDDTTAAVLMEPIQGEGGMHTWDSTYIARVRELCDKHAALLIFDEVWTGVGRTGKWFCHQHFAKSDGSGIEPDIMTLGKAIGGGLPVGVMFAKPDHAKHLVPGKHGCTLGGNPLCTAVSRTLLDVIERDHLLDRATELGQQLLSRLQSPTLKARIKEVRGHGLFWGIDMHEPPKDLVQQALAAGVILNVTAGTVVRLAPPLTIPQEQYAAALDVVCKLLEG